MAELTIVKDRVRNRKPDYGSAIEKWALQLFFHFLMHLMTNSHAKGSAKKNLVPTILTLNSFFSCFRVLDPSLIY